MNNLVEVVIYMILGHKAPEDFSRQKLTQIFSLEHVVQFPINMRKRKKLFTSSVSCSNTAKSLYSLLYTNEVATIFRSVNFPSFRGSDGGNTYSFEIRYISVLHGCSARQVLGVCERASPREVTPSPVPVIIVVSANSPGFLEEKVTCLV